MCFFKSAEEAYLEQREPISTMKNLLGMKYSFQKLTEFLQGNNVLHAAASNIDGFVWCDICFSSTLLKSPIANKQSLSTP
jgi:hypothetical protein